LENIFLKDIFPGITFLEIIFFGIIFFEIIFLGITFSGIILSGNYLECSNSFGSSNASNMAQTRRQTLVLWQVSRLEFIRMQLAA
jgi:hypothetical protein